MTDSRCDFSHKLKVQICGAVWFGLVFLGFLPFLLILSLVILCLLILSFLLIHSSLTECLEKERKIENLFKVEKQIPRTFN